MKQVQTHNNQTWFDISVWLYGTIEHVFYLAKLNNSSIAADIPAGSIINIPEELAINKLVLASMKVTPATALTLEQIKLTQQPEGINYWAIEEDFIVQ